MQGNKWRTKANLKKQNSRSNNRHVAPCMREQKERINHQTKDFVAREVENKRKKKDCAYIIKSISMMNLCDEHYYSTNKDEAMHRVTVDTPEDVFLGKEI